ncbi:unnamed protein product [Orchesella dallaii]|uniref:BRCT domain-containing protein n=1 Tax=Orchesella dallaii TaxID=48710 RepID=A0ABP1R018_9HEXA
MEKLVAGKFIDTIKVIQELIGNVSCVRCKNLEKQVYVLNCCWAKYCKNCAKETCGELCAKCATKRSKTDFQNDLFSSSVAELLIPFRDNALKDRTNVVKFLAEANLLLSKIEGLGNFKTMPESIPKVPTSFPESEVAVFALTKSNTSETEGKPESALRSLTDMEPAGAASSLKILTVGKSAGGSKLLDQAVEKCIKNAKHEADEKNRSSLSTGADSKCVKKSDSTDKNSNGNDSDKKDSVKDVEECSPSENDYNEDYSKAAWIPSPLPSPLQPDSDQECEPKSLVMLHEYVSDEELFESSPVCVPASPEILGITPPKITKASPNTLLKRSQAKRLASLETSDMSPAKKKLSSFTDYPSGLIGVNTIVYKLDMTSHTGSQLDDLEKLAEIQYESDSSPNSDETMEEEEESENENKLASPSLVKPSPSKDEILARFRTPSKVGKTSYGSQYHTNSDDFDIRCMRANPTLSVISMEEESTLSETNAIPEESKMETLKSDTAVQGEISMLDSGIIKTVVPDVDAAPLLEKAGSDEDLFGEDAVEISNSQAPQLTPYPLSDNIDNMSTEEEDEKEQLKPVKLPWDCKRRNQPTRWHGRRPPPLLIRTLRKRQHEESTSALDSMPPLLTPQFTVSRAPSTSARSALEEILDMGTNEERELREMELSQKASRAAVQDKSESFSTPAKEKRNAKGETQLHIACRNGNLQKVQELLENGAEIGATDYAGWIPLHDAVSGKGEDVAKAAIVKLLCQKGCNVNALGGIEEDTPLHEAAFYGLERIVEILLSFGAVPSIRNADGKLPRDVSDNNFIIKLLDRRSDDKSMSLNATSMAYLALEDPSLNQIRSQKALFYFNFDISDRVLHEVMTRLNLRYSGTLSDKVTHIVYETSTENEEDRLAPFSWEYMFGLAKGLWQVSHHWISKSLYHSRCLPLNDFEISGCGEPADKTFSLLEHQSFKGTTGIPGLSRVNREKGVSDLISKHGFSLNWPL